MRSLFVLLCLLTQAACQPVRANDQDGSIGPDAMTCMNDIDCTGTARHCFEGVCVQCLSVTDCSGGQVCDENSHECRGCGEHAECASNVCDPVAQTCVINDSVVYVDAANGTFDPDCGSKQLPCNSLETALTKLTASRSYLSLFGTFNFPKLTFSTKVTIVGYGSAILDSGFDPANAAPLIDVKAGADVAIDGVWIIKNQGGDGITCTSAKLFVAHSRVLQNTQYGIRANGCDVYIGDTEIAENGQFAVSSDKPMVLHSNLIARNARGGVTSCSDGVDIRNNVFWNNTTDSQFSYDGAIELFCGEGQLPGVVAFNTFVGNNINGFERGLIACSGQVNLVIDSNIIYGNNVQTGPTVTSCPGLGKNLSDQNLNTQTIVADPLFVDGDVGNFHLQAGSPARNQGASAHALSFDFDGTSRDGEPDMGAFEAP